jgi:hypothetical protein
MSKSSSKSKIASIVDALTPKPPVIWNENDPVIALHSNWVAAKTAVDAVVVMYRDEEDFYGKARQLEGEQCLAVAADRLAEIED